MIWCNSQNLILHTEGEFGAHDLAWDEYCSPCPNAGSTYLHYCFTCHLPRGMQDLPAGLQSYLLSHHSDSLGAVSNPPCLFTEPFSQVSNKYVHEHSPKQYSTGDLPPHGKRGPFPLTFYILPSNQLINNPETPLSLMAFAFSKAFSEKPCWKLYGNPSRHYQLGCPSHRSCPLTHRLPQTTCWKPIHLPQVIQYTSCP